MPPARKTRLQVEKAKSAGRHGSARPRQTARAIRRTRSQRVR